jgi:hypothetical protein
MGVGRVTRHSTHLQLLLLKKLAREATMMPAQTCHMECIADPLLPAYVFCSTHGALAATADTETDTETGTKTNMRRHATCAKLGPTFGNMSPLSRMQVQA